MCTPKTALVLGVMAFSTSVGSIRQVFGSISTYTGVKPVHANAWPVTEKVKLGRITYPFKFMHLSISSKPEVALETATACLAPK